MKQTLMALMALVGVATAQAATLDLDITDWDNQNYDLSKNQYDVINIFGNGSVNFDVFYTSASGTQLNISDGATVHLNDIVVSGGPVGIDLNGGTFDLSDAPMITIMLDNADLSKEGELNFPFFYYDSSQLEGDFFANIAIINSLINSSASFVTLDGSSYEYMIDVSVEMDVESNMNLNVPEGCAVYSVKATNSKVIPEPTTATLSLLALAGLAARRRRK